MSKRPRLPWPFFLGLPFAVALLFLWPGIGGGKTGTGRPGSSFATIDEGALGAYLLLEKLGHRIERRTMQLGQLGERRLAFVLAPDLRLDKVDGKGVLDWVEAGGTLVYGVAAFEPSAEVLRAALELPTLLVVPMPAAALELTKPYAPAKQLHAHVRVKASGDADDEDSEIEVTSLARLGGKAAALEIERGEGRILVVDARVFSNGGLKERDNALFLAVLAARFGGDAPISFDEFVHGYGEVTSILATVAWPLKLALALFALALAAYALGVGRRLGAVAPDPAPPRRASIEQIETLASFYAGKRASAEGRAAALLALGAAPAMIVPNNDRDLVATAQDLRKNPVRKGSSPSWP